MPLIRGERLQIMLTGDELDAVDDFRFKHRMPTRAAAVRELFRLGMAAQGVSAAFGVLKKTKGAESEAKRPVIPTEGGHPIRSKAATDSDRRRPPC